jgi:putative ABC transport system ATP-binding protein
MKVLPVAVDARVGHVGTRIDLDGVCRHYRLGDAVVRAPDDVDLHVDERAFVVVLGASGSGKTTLLNMVDALDSPTAGTVRLAGTDLTSAGIDLALLAVVVSAPQRAGLQEPS